MYPVASTARRHGRGRASAPKTATFRRRRLPWRRTHVDGGGRGVSRRNRLRAPSARTSLLTEDGHVPTTTTSMAEDAWRRRRDDVSRRNRRRATRTRASLRTEDGHVSTTTTSMAKDACRRRRDDVSRRSRRRATWARASLHVEDGRIPTTVTSMARMWTYRTASTARRHGPGRGRRARPDDGGSHGGERRRNATHRAASTAPPRRKKATACRAAAPLRGVSWTGDAFHRSHLGRKADGVVGTIARSVMDGERFPPITPWTQSRQVRGTDDAAKFEERQRGHRRPPGGRRHRHG